jgi:hypothetical protein
MQFVVVGDRLAVEHLVDHAAQRRDGQAHANHRAVGVAVELPQPAAP